MNTKRIFWIAFGIALLMLVLTLPQSSLAAPSGCTPGRDVGRDFFVQVVGQLKDVAQNDFAVDALMAWEPHENTAACWNPLATTWKMEVVSYFNCLRRDDAGNCTMGVQNYQDQAKGTRATANTLNLTYYDAIRKMFRMEAFDREAMRKSLGLWGTCRGTGCDSILNKWQTLWTNYSSGPSGYTICAGEGQRCEFSGTRDVAYGANGQFNYQYGVSGGIDCNNNVFGDPLVGVSKACYTKDNGSGGPNGYGYCAGEHQRCDFSGTRDVAYGANGQFYYKTWVTGGVDCNNENFGDPLVGAGKACYTKESRTGPSGYTPCAWENQRCDFSGTRDVAYGANGQFYYKTWVTGGVDCNNGTFGDPLLGVGKACYTKESIAGPSGYALCATENQRCNFSGSKDVAYGASGNFNYKYGITDGIDCNNGTFGDPLVGTTKACYIKDSASTTKRLVAQHSNRCLDVYDNTQENGGMIIQWDCHNGNNQAWNLVPAGGDYYKLMVNHSGKCLDVFGASPDNGAYLVQWDCHGGDNQLFKKEAMGAYYRLRAKHSNRCVDVYGAQTDNGVRLIQWDCHDGANQLWSIQDRSLLDQEDAGLPAPEYVLSAPTYTTKIITHTAQTGEDLTKIIGTYQVSVDQIVAANPGLKVPEAIEAGVTFYVPVKVPSSNPNTGRIYLPLMQR
jgi:hypothetical protein